MEIQTQKGGMYKLVIEAAINCTNAAIWIQWIGERWLIIFDARNLQYRSCALDSAASGCCTINLKNQLLLLPSLLISEKTWCQGVPHVYWVPLRFPSSLVLLYLLSETTGWEFMRKKEMKTFDLSSKLSLSKKLWIQLELGLYMRVLGVVWFHSIEASYLFCLTGFYYLQQLNNETQATSQARQSCGWYNMVHWPPDIIN